MPHWSKGSSSCFVPSCNQTHRVSAAEFCFNQSSPFMSEQRRGGRRQRIRQTPHKEVAFSQQHSQLKERKSSLSSVFKNVVFSLSEAVKAGPCSNFNCPYRSHTSLFFFFSFLCVLDIKKQKKRIRLKCLLVSMISQTMPTQTSALCLFSDCHALFVSLGNASTQIHTDSHGFVGSGGNEGWRMERSRWGGSPS